MTQLSRPMGGRTPHTPWGASKVQRTISVTDEAWGLWTETAIAAGVNRSELFEIVSRLLTSIDVVNERTRLLAAQQTKPAG